MSAISVTFKCGSCSNLLSIGEELRGQVVRCPFCQQVIQVPVQEPVAARSATEPPAPVSAMETSPAAAANGEAASAPPAVHDGPNWGDLLPHLAPTPPANDGTPAQVLVPASSPTGDQAAAWQNEAAAELRESGAAPPTFDADRASDLVSSEPAPPPAPAEMLVPAPWDQAVLPAPAPAETTAAPGLAPRPARKLPASVWLLSILLPYSILATVALVFFVKRGLDRQPHPLESIQDEGLYEDIAFDGRRREKVPDLEDLKDPKKRDKIDPIKNELPASIPRLKLGQTGRFGGIEVTPIEVRRHKLDFTHLPAERQAVRGEEALVLKLRIKNVSHLIFHPNDATFNRAAKNDVYTFLEIGSRQFYGVVRDPLTERVKGQRFDELLPGGEIETLVVAFDSPTQEKAVEAIAKAEPDQALTWRVHLRKGREDVRLLQGNRVRPVWVTTIVPVVFTPAEVKAVAASDQTPPPF